MDPLTDEEKARLLERHRPWLLYDSQAAYFAVAASTATDNPTNRLVRGRQVLAARGGVPQLSLKTLCEAPQEAGELAAAPAPADYDPPELANTQLQPGALASGGGDRLQFGPDQLGDAIRMQSEPKYRDRAYGRVVEGELAIHVQYWFWFYSAAARIESMSPKWRFATANFSNAGAWRLVQVDLDPDRRPTRVVLEGSGVAWRPWLQVRRIGTHPRLFVAPLTQCFFFEPRIALDQREAWDGSDGRGRRACPQADQFTGFEHWPGRWGTTDYAPQSPGSYDAWKQPGKVVPAAFRRRLGRVRGVRLWYVAAMREKLPSPLTLGARLEQAQVVVSYQASGTTPWALLFTVHRCDAVELVGRTVSTANEQSGEVQVPVPAGLGACDVRVSSFNRYGRRRRFLLTGLAANAPDALEASILRTVVAEQMAAPDIERFRVHYGVASESLAAAIRYRESEVWKAVATELQAFRNARLEQVRRQREAAAEAKSARRRLIWGSILMVGAAAMAVAIFLDLFSIWFGVVPVYLGFLGVAGAQLDIYRRRRRAGGSPLNAATAEGEDEPPLAGARRAFERALTEKAVAPIMRELINAETKELYDAELDFGARGLSELRVPESEVRTAAADQLDSLVARMRGGSVGIAGLRGVGKSTLIRAHCQPRTPGDRRLTAELSAPVRYDARDFILTLFAQLCDAVIGGEPGRRAHAARTVFGVRIPWLVAVLAVTAAVVILIAMKSADVYLRAYCAATAVIVVMSALGLLLDVTWPPYLRSMAAVGFAAPLVVVALQVGEDESWQAWALGAGGALVALGILTLPQALPVVVPPALATAEERLQALATSSRDEIRFQQSWSHGYSGKLAVPLGAEVSAQKQQSLERRQTTFPELVDQLRAFLTLAVEAREAVAIGIDEMDKMESGEMAEQFLNELKAIFGVERCLYLVSISENAMSSFERRGLPFRDVFDSSFDEVLTLTPLPLGDSKRLLRGRVLGLGPTFLDLAHCLSGGLPRDLLRVTRRLSLYDGDDRTLAEVCRTLVKNELDRTVAAALVAARAVPLEPDMSDLQLWLRSLRTVAPDGDALLAASATVPARWTGESTREAEQAAHCDKLEQLRLELAAFTYYLATVVDFFAAEVPSLRKHFRKAERNEDDGTSGLDELASARVAFAVNPRLAATIVTDFRARHGWPRHRLQWRGEPNEVKK